MANSFSIDTAHVVQLFLQDTQDSTRQHTDGSN